MNSFSFEIKNELISKELNKKQASAFINGIIFSSLRKDSEEIKVSFKNNLIFNGIKIFLTMSGKEHQIKNQTFIFPPTDLSKLLISDPQHFFAGAFVAKGSISALESSSYHLQIKIKNQDVATIILEKLNHHNLNFSFILKKEDHIIIYIKKNDQISEFLKAIGSQNSFFKFFDAIINRDHKNQITRISNLDIYNQSKLVDSHALFLDNYKFIVEHNLIIKFKENELIFYNFKIKNPYLPLSEISEELAIKHNIFKTKSGLNHWLIKIRKIAEDYEYKLEVKGKKN